MALSSIYQGALLEHNSNPSCRHELDDATHSLKGVNPNCGDDVTLSFVIGEGNVIEKAAFTGNGCAVSQASADIMAELVMGKSLDEAVELAKVFAALIHGDQITDEQREALGEAADLEGISRMPARVKCALLGWNTLEEMAADLDGSAV